MRRVYGMCGFMGSGKNAAAHAILLQYGHPTPRHVHSFANALKDGVAAIFSWPRELLEGDSEKSRTWRETPDPYWSDAFGRVITPRTALQEVGTNLFRAWLPNFWVAATAARAQSEGLHIFTDARFHNEMSWLRQTGGLLIWVYRPDTDQLNAHDRANIAQLVRSAASLKSISIPPLTTSLHPSETSFLTEGADCIDVVIENTGDVHTLHKLAAHVDDLWTRGLIGNQQPYTQYVSMQAGTFIWRWTDGEGYQTRTYAILSTSHDTTKGTEGHDDANV